MDQLDLKRLSVTELARLLRWVTNELAQRLSGKHHSQRQKRTKRGEPNWSANSLSNFATFGEPEPRSVVQF